MYHTWVGIESAHNPGNGSALGTFWGIREATMPEKRNDWGLGKTTFNPLLYVRAQPVHVRELWKDENKIEGSAWVGINNIAFVYTNAWRVSGDWIGLG